MLQHYRKIMGLIFSLTLISCSPTVEHEPIQAAKTALIFLKKVVFDDRLKIAYTQTHRLFQRVTPIEIFNQFIKLSHTNGYPRKISTTSFEISDDGKILSVLLEGITQTKQLYYKVNLIGSKTKDYQVLGVHIDNTKFVASGERAKYKKKRSIRRSNSLVRPAITR